MPCYHPIIGYRSRSGRDPLTGTWPIVFNINEGYIDKEIKLPCGRCIGCRLERSRQWAIRCVHEAKLHEENCFITLTFNRENECESLEKTDFQKFMKRLRKKYGDGIRFFHCGEYGEKFRRPHHHACLFNHDFDDKELWQKRNGVELYRSKQLEELWPYGYCTVGDVTFESAAYVARYVVKKITGEKSKEHYDGRLPEYITMSRRPGIGKGFVEKFQSDIYPRDSMVVRDGIVCKPPRYYDDIYDRNDHSQMERIKYRRNKEALLNSIDCDELARKEEFKKYVYKQQMKRGYENGDEDL